RSCIGSCGRVRSQTFCPQRCYRTQIIQLAATILQSSRTLSKIESLGQVAELSKAAARKSCYTTQVVSEVRILPLSAKSEYSTELLRTTPGTRTKETCAWGISSKQVTQLF